MKISHHSTNLRMVPSRPLFAKHRVAPKRTPRSYLILRTEIVVELRAQRRSIPGISKNRSAGPDSVLQESHRDAGLAGSHDPASKSQTD
jgi:hypothetical protein